MRDNVEKAVSLKERTDLIIIQAGICDFTRRNKFHGTKILNYEQNNQVSHVLKSLKHLRDKLGDKANVATIIPASLIKYINFHKRNAESPQHIIESAQKQGDDLLKDIQEVNKDIIEWNKEHNIKTIDLHSRVYSSSVKRRKNKKKLKRTVKFQDKQLFDGVHPDQKLSTKLHQRTWDIIEQTLIKKLPDVALEDSDSESQSEEESWDFKRPKK